jgi:5-methylcytosine-specific restriction enzyme B
LDTEHLNDRWDSFLKTWPLERVHGMTFKEYTNPNREDSFIYWLEKHLEELGSIWGGSAFKFGIYCREDKETKKPSGGRIWGEEYAWYGKYGQTEQEAFKTVRDRVIQIIEAVQAGNLELVDEIDFSPAVKWKIAFLYQSREKPQIFPVYKEEWLFFHYSKIAPSAKRSRTPFSLMYASLLDHYKDTGDIFSIAERVWKEWKAARNKETRAWAVPLTGMLEGNGSIETLCQTSVVSSELIPPYLNELLEKADLSVDDKIVLLVDADVRAVGGFTNTDPNEYSWAQTPVQFPAELVPVPKYEIKELDAAEWQKIRSKVPISDIEQEDAQEALPQPTEVRATHKHPCIPRNIILYGPPGTGKTYSTIQRALELIIDEDRVSAMSPETQMRQFRQLQQEGQIEFVTFHQSYGYEEFIEGIRPLLEEGNTNEVRYELHDGVFKRIALRAAADGLRDQVKEPSFDALWSQFLKNLALYEDRIVESVTGKKYVLRSTSRDNIAIYPCEIDEEGAIKEIRDSRMLATKESTKLVWEHREKIGPEPEKINSTKTTELFSYEYGGGGGHHFPATWLAYREIWELSRLRRQEFIDPVIRVQELLVKSTPGLVDFQFSASSRQYVLIIDEINRGNMSKILGELITLLEPEKRLGTPGELKLPLSYSPGSRFAVPPNLHIIGTMNTADRSIALMDVAMRRRFSFEELMPESEVIREILVKKTSDPKFIDLVIEIFETLNERIRFLYDRDHQLGHTYFLHAINYDKLRRVFGDRIIPLLQEYFYDSWDKICMVLGCPYDDGGQPRRIAPAVIDGQYRAPIIQVDSYQKMETLGFDHDDFESRLDYQVSPLFTSEKTDQEKLIPFFLGVLNLEAGIYDEREKELEEEIQISSSERDGLS